MVVLAGLWPLSSPLAGQKRPPILPAGAFFLFGVCPHIPRLHVSRSVVTVSLKRKRASFIDSPHSLDDTLIFRAVGAIHMMCANILCLVFEKTAGDRSAKHSQRAVRTLSHSGGNCAIVRGGFGFSGWGFGWRIASENHQASEESQPSPGGTES
jgi:hypothetical protein